MTDHPNLQYTVFIKVPFPRGEFEDPPHPRWTALKDKELWKTLSSASKGKDIDWEALAQTFDVTIQFLLQQAAWLYEKQLSQVREQLRKVGKNPSGTSPVPASVTGSAAGSAAGTASGGNAMRRGGSSGASRVPSSLSIRQRASGDFRNDSSVPSTPLQGRAPYSRTASKETVTQLPQSGLGQQDSPKSRRRSAETTMRDTEILTRKRSDPKSPSTDDSSRPSSSSSDTAPTQSRAFARRPNFSSPKSKKAPLTMLSSADEDEEDDSPAFLPYSDVRETQPRPRDQVSKGKEKSIAAFTKEPPAANPYNSSSQSPQSSSVPSMSSPTTNPARPSPMAALSPRQRRIAQEGSEGTPSMGSSFSDLDDASLTQSALEEALAREIKAGKGSLGVVSRVGGLWKGHNQGQGQGSRRPG